MRETELAVPADDGLLVAGTLSVPAGEGPHPAVVLLCPGTLDREGDSRRARTALGRALAGALAAQGVACYRFDRRGIGRTPGDPEAMGFYRQRDDAAAVLRAVAARPEVSTVGAIGYSEAALHAAWLAAHADAAAVVLLGCPARTGRDVLAWAISRWYEDEVPPPGRLALRLLGRSPRQTAGRIADRIEASTGRVTRVYGIRMPPSYREYLGHDPLPDLAAIRVPVLALTGTKDRQVDPADLATITRVVPGPVEACAVPDLTHVLRRVSGHGSLRTYRKQYRRPVDPQLLEQVAIWLAAHLPGGHS
ncbi:MAG: alpha/beta fold hydrolase [Streptosporangiales bacterium]|nr:alpha/beta fold hydrolase [Streptosporangiales bacterium]